MVDCAILAVAGSRKTQGLVEHCASMPADRRALLVTFTQANQAELKSRLASFVGAHLNVAVTGWYTFLLRDFVRPFLPFKFPGERVRGFNFDGRPHLKAKDKARFLDSKGAVYACELGRLALELMDCSFGKLQRRLECVYDEILIDEVQDLSGYDWEIVDRLVNSSISLRMVGDVRQSVLATNPRSSKNKKYAYANALTWFREREHAGRLEIMESITTWRCHPLIAAFSDSIFDSSWSFPKTISKNSTNTDHDGVFLVLPEHVDAYVERYAPVCLRDSVRSGKTFDLEFLNFRIAKGMSCERVLIVPTAGITEFIQKGRYLEPFPASKFYVAVTRAEQSVAIVVDDPGKSNLPYWMP